MKNTTVINYIFGQVLTVNLSMAKQIKIIKCPQCGSVKNTQLKEDYFKCSNCGTEYFLDNDDININVNHTNVPPPVDTSKVGKTVGGVIAGIFSVVIIFSSIFGHRSSRNTYNLASSKSYSERIYHNYAYSSSGSNDPKLLFMVVKDFNESNKKDEIYMRFYDPLKGKTLNDILIPEWTEAPASLYIRKFSNGKTYLTAYEQNKIYEINTDQMNVKDVTTELISGYPELSSGLAKVSLVSEDEGDGFKIMTNDGKDCTFYPIAKSVYKDYNELDRARKSGSVENIYYVFTEKSTSYKEGIQLIKAWYKENPGYPRSLDTRPSWHMDFGGSGIFTDADPHKKVLFNSNIITHFIDLTPDRLYFEPSLAASDKNNLYITGFANANPNSMKFLQKIDVNTGKVLWTYTPNVEKYSLDDKFSLYNDGIVFRYYNYGSPGRVDKLAIVNKEGKLVKELDLDNLF